MSLKHTLNIYQRPQQGESFLRQVEAYQYSHRKAAYGGDDKASCNVRITPDEGLQWIENYLGCRVAIFVQDVKPIWEGFINRITVNSGTITYTASLDKMYNRMQTTYQSINMASGNIQQTANSSDTTSQSIYGIKDGKIDMYNLGIESDTSRTTILRNYLLSELAFPQVSTTFNSQGGDVSVNIEMLGFYHWLDWITAYNNSYANAARTPTQLFTLWLNDYPNTSMISATDTALIDTNTSWSSARANDRKGITYWQKFQEIAEIGDGTSQWITGVRVDPNTGARRVYYEAAGTTLDYTISRRDGLVRNLYGGRMPPYLVEPNRAVRNTDFIGNTSDSEFYIEAVDYDAESQSVQLTGYDDITAEGAFQFNRYYKSSGSRFGKDIRDYESIN